MAVKIRLRQLGKKNRQTFRLVAIDGKCRRDGKYLENLGWYQPCEKENNLHVEEERVGFWLGKGAELSEKAQTLLSRAAPALLKELRAKRAAKRDKVRTQRKGKKEGASAIKA